MTKQHFEWAARELSQRERITLETQEIEDFLVGMFKHFSTRFDESRFRAACNPAHEHRKACVKREKVSRVS